MYKYILYTTQSEYPLQGFSYRIGMAIGGDIHGPRSRKKLKVFYDEEEGLAAINELESKLIINGDSVLLSEYFLDQDSGVFGDLWTIAISKLDKIGFELYLLNVDHSLATDIDKYTITIESLSNGSLDQYALKQLKLTSESKYQESLDELYQEYLKR